jgi:hypothetical protein
MLIASKADLINKAVEKFGEWLDNEEAEKVVNMAEEKLGVEARQEQSMESTRDEPLEGEQNGSLCNNQPDAETKKANGAVLIPREEMRSENEGNFYDN